MAAATIRNREGNWYSRFSTVYMDQTQIQRMAFDMEFAMRMAVHGGCGEEGILDSAVQVVKFHEQARWGNFLY